MYKFILLAYSLLFYSNESFASSRLGISALLTSPETLLFIIVISLVTMFLLRNFNKFSVSQGPEILTTLGIFGCFISIAWALLNFDSSNLANSIPILLDGIKTAFCASVFGVGGALAIKLKYALRKEPLPQAEGASKSASFDDVVNSILSLQKGLVGTEEGTLLSQMKLHRHDTVEQLQKIRDAFSEFSDHMIENNQKALIEALKQVISDFNQNLTEQFGENFKELNLAVGKLVIWQQQYKDELEEIKRVQLQTATDMKKASEAFTTVLEKTSEFSVVAGKLGEILAATNAQKNILFEQERALSELLLQMKDVTPQFAIKLTEMLSEITSGVKKIQSETTEIVKNYGAQTQSANAEMKNLLTEVVNKSQQQLSEGLQANSKIIKEGVLALDKALQKELNDSLSSLGKQLASLSEKFVEDYTPLTDKLREVVRLASAA